MKRTDEELEQQLQHWYQQSRQQNGMPAALKQQLAATMQSQPAKSMWRVGLHAVLQYLGWRNIQALTAVLALGIGWQLLQQERLYYQISQSNDLYPVQVHQITQQPITDLPTAGTKKAEPNIAATASGSEGKVIAGQGKALFQQQYQDYVKTITNSQPQRQLIVSRQFSEDGWHLDLCQQMQLQLTSEWLAQFKLQQHWSEPQWQQLQQSDWLQLTTGAQGQILALKRSEQPPACAP